MQLYSAGLELFLPKANLFGVDGIFVFSHTFNLVQTNLPFNLETV